MSRFIPDSIINRLNFFKDLLAGILAKSDVLGWSADRMKAVVSTLERLIEVFGAADRDRQQSENSNSAAAKLFDEMKPNSKR